MLRVRVGPPDEGAPERAPHDNGHRSRVQLQADVSTNHPARLRRTTTERPTGSLLASASPRGSERPRNRLATARVSSFASTARLGARAPTGRVLFGSEGRRRRWAVQARPRGLRRVADERGCAGLVAAAPDGRAGALVERE